jgi:hypothetical protein
MAKPRLKTFEYANVCSSHLPSGDMAILQQLSIDVRSEDCPLRVHELLSGYMVLCNTFDPSNWPAVQREGLSRMFLAIMQDACNQGCIFVFFQPWGFEHEGYPIFDHSRAGS